MVLFVDVLIVSKVYSWKFGGFFVIVLDDVISFNFCIRIQLVYNIVLVSGMQQSDSTMHIAVLFQILFPYRLVQNIRVPCAIQQVLIDYLFYIYNVCVCVCVCVYELQNVKLSHQCTTQFNCVIQIRYTPNTSPFFFCFMPACSIRW